MQLYIMEHFTRTREDWEIKCITPSAWRDKKQLGIQIHGGSEFNIRHRNSRVQQYANSGEERRQQINSLGNITNEHEIRKAITKLSNRKSVRYDELTAEILKVNIERLIQIIKTMFNQIPKHKEVPKGWLNGVMTFLQKKKARGDLDNYRAIALINTIYKIWETIMSQRLNPILNLPTDDDQYA